VEFFGSPRLSRYHDQPELGNDRRIGAKGEYRGQTVPVDAFAALPMTVSREME
jgi:hypothetical protein